MMIVFEGEAMIEEKDMIGLSIILKYLTVFTNGFHRLGFRPVRLI